MSEPWETLLLGNVLALEYGKAMQAERRTGEGFPVFGSSGQVGMHSHALVQGPGIVVGRKGTVGSVIWSPSDFWPIDTTYFVQTQLELDLKWLYWMLSTVGMQGLDSSTGVPGLNRNDAYGLSISFPPLPEQQRIAEILDTLDEAIRKTEQVIAKLQQVKQGLLHDLLTRGIDEHGELRDPDRHPEQFKDSELGRVPRAWEVRALAQVADIRSGIAKNSGRVLPNSVTVDYLRVANVQDGFLDLREMSQISVPRVQLDRYRVLPGDVLMNEGGDLDKLGRGALWRGEIDVCVHQNHVFVVRSGPLVDAPYLDAWTGSWQARRYFLVAGKQTTNLASINKTALGGLPVLLPPVGEQRRIVACLESHEETPRWLDRELFKLRAVKSALMHDLLTGRVRTSAL